MPSGDGHGEHGQEEGDINRRQGNMENMIRRILDIGRSMGMGNVENMIRSQDDMENR